MLGQVPFSFLFNSFLIPFPLLLSALIPSLQLSRRESFVKDLRYLPASRPVLQLAWCSSPRCFS